MTLEQSLQLLNLPNSVTGRWIEQLREPHRHYHTRDHIEHMLANVPAGNQRNKELTAAIWLHDIVYDPKATDNEERSADQAIADLDGSGIKVATVHRLIMATKHHEPIQTSTLADNMIDLDLLILGETPDRYDAYARAIRLEYSHVPIASYRANRALFMQHFLDSPQIYRGNSFQSHEKQARENIAREIRELMA